MGVEVMILAVVVSLAIGITVSLRRNGADVRPWLEPPLRECGVTLISAINPGLFKVGPFPKFEWSVGRPQSHVGGIRGEYGVYKIVKFQDEDGGLHEIWARVEFELFRFRRVRWRAERREGLPESVLAILEN